MVKLTFQTILDMGKISFRSVLLSVHKITIQRLPGPKRKIKAFSSKFLPRLKFKYFPKIHGIPGYLEQ